MDRNLNTMREDHVTLEEAPEEELFEELWSVPKGTGKFFRLIDEKFNNNEQQEDLGQTIADQGFGHTFKAAEEEDQL